MADLNSVALTGRIAEEPKLIERGSLRVARLRLLVESVRRDRDSGELEPRQHLFRVGVFGNPAEEAAKLRAGTHVGVRGQLSQSTFTDDAGAVRESVEITTADWVRPLGPLGQVATQPDRKPAAETKRPPPGADPSALPW